MKTRYEKVLVADRLPDVYGQYITDHKRVTIQDYSPLDPEDKEYWLKNFTWWLEELPEPTDEDIEIWAKSVQPQHGGYLTDYIYSAKAMRDGKIHIQNK
jgi:1-aminocyclopropane-1-carboxylate deaminase/D-cysteine desulfhydrase-like pyridoxal-dependent ACC family enzyme